MFSYKVVERIMHDIDQCKILGISYAKTLVINGKLSFDYYKILQEKLGHLITKCVLKIW